MGVSVDLFIYLLSSVCPCLDHTDRHITTFLLYFLCLLIYMLQQQINSNLIELIIIIAVGKRILTRGHIRFCVITQK